MFTITHPRFGIKVEAKTEAEAQQLLLKELEKINNPEPKKKVNSQSGQISTATEKSVKKTSQ